MIEPDPPHLLRQGREHPNLDRLRIFESVVINARDAIAITLAEPLDDSGPAIVFVNPAFEAMTGYSAAELLGNTPRMMHGPATDPAVRATLRGALERCEPVRVELLNYRKDASPFWAELSIVPIADESGTCTHFVSVQRDVTERIDRDAALARARAAEAEVSVLVREIEERRLAEDRLSHSAFHDNLTGLRNRLFFMSSLERAVRRAGRQRRDHALLFLDLDRFKPVNDRFGHEIGDRLLHDVASRIACCANSGDVLARLGGDEFAILMRDTDGEAAIERAECIARSFDEPFSLGVGEVSMTLSIGIRVFAQGESDVETLLRDVDAAMYRAKRAGGNGCVMFSGAIETERNDVRRTRKELDGVVERDELRLVLQPLVDVLARRVYGYEALVRWQHPVRGLLGPIDFVSLAEETGSIAAIGAWVLERACRAALAIGAGQTGPPSISVNVSSRELLAPGFYANLVRSLERTNFPPSLLQIEITESMFLADAAIVGKLFERIRELGVKIAFDDFGTGYSSLSYLERFQFDALKIDRSFVAHVCDLSTKAEIVRMIVSLAHALGVEVIAEGVETREQLDALLQIGCTKVQGFLYSRPVPEAELVDLVRTDFAGNLELQNVFVGRPLGVPQLTLSPTERATLFDQVREALVVHESRVSEFAAAILRGDTSLDPGVVADPLGCQIGMWLAETIDKRLRTSPLYVITNERHAAFHRNAARLLALAQTGDPGVRASVQSGGDFMAVAALMRRALEDWLALADLPENPFEGSRSVGGAER